MAIDMETADGELADGCQEVLDDAVEYDGADPETVECVCVQFVFDVPGEVGTAPNGDDYDTANAEINAVITPEGRQIGRNSG